MTFQLQYDGSGTDYGDGDAPGKGSLLMIKDYRVTGDHIDLREFYFSNEEYYRKLEELKRAHLRTMAELEGMYRKKLELKGTPPSENVQGAQAHRCVVALVWNLLFFLINHQDNKLKLIGYIISAPGVYCTQRLPFLTCQLILEWCKHFVRSPDRT